MIYNSIFTIVISTLIIACVYFAINIYAKKPLTKEKFKDDVTNIPLNDKCNFVGDGFGNSHENGECSVAFYIIPKYKSVIEIGGGTGKISHVINSLLVDKTQHIVIEPDSTGWASHLKKNKERFGDKYTIIEKYAENLHVSDLQVFKSDPECLFVDCEGCLESFFATDIGKHVLSKAKCIVNEMDGFTKHNTLDDNLRTLWSKNGFHLTHIGFGCGTTCKTEVWEK